MASRSSSKAIPDHISALLLKRLRAHAIESWPSCIAVNVRTRGVFAYVEAQVANDSEPEPLCRLRYMGNIDTWEFAYFTWARETYEPSYLDNGTPFGSPEDCFDAAAHSVLGGRPQTPSFGDLTGPSVAFSDFFADFWSRTPSFRCLYGPFQRP
jgi:hypothetical protein